MANTIRKNKEKRKNKKKVNDKSVKKKRKNNKGKKDKTLKKNKQRGGIGAIAVIAGISTLAVTAIGAFAKYKHSELLKERSKIDNIIAQDSNLEYIPRYIVVEDKNMIERYLKCITDSEFIELVSENQDYLKSDTINDLIKPYRNMDTELRELSDKYEMLLGNDKEDTSLKIDTIELSTTSDSLVKELRYYLLTIASIKDSNSSKSDKNKIAKENVNWIDIIIDGGLDYDHKYEIEVDRILSERGSSYFITEEIKIILKKMKSNHKLIQAINKKMEACTREPRSYLDFISGNIKWNNTKKCLVCPEEDCLIYIYDYYYDFLKDNDNVPILHKLYVLMLCEARICALSKPLILEALRQTSGDKSEIKSLLDKIYERDKSRNLVNTTIPSKFADISIYKKPSENNQSGGEVRGDVPNNPDIGGLPDSRSLDPGGSLMDVSPGAPSVPTMDTGAPMDTGGTPLLSEESAKESPVSGESSVTGKSIEAGEPSVTGGPMEAGEPMGEGSSSGVDESNQLLGLNTPTDSSIGEERPSMEPEKISETDYKMDDTSTKDRIGNLPNDLDEELEKKKESDKELSANVSKGESLRLQRSFARSQLEENLFIYLGLNEANKSNMSKQLTILSSDAGESSSLITLDNPNLFKISRVIKNDLFKLNVDIKNLSPENLNTIDCLFPMYERLFVYSDKYEKSSSLYEDFKLFFRMFSYFPDIFGFISPYFIGLFFFNVSPIADNKYWNFNIESIFQLATRIMNRTSNTPVVYMVTMAILLSRSSEISQRDVGLAQFESSGPDPIAPEPMAPEPVVPESVTPEPVVPESVASNPMAPDSTAPDSMAPEPMAPESVASNPMAPESMASNPMASESMASNPMAPDSTAPNPMAPDSTAPNPMAPDSTAPNPMAPDSTAPMAPESMAPESMAPESMASNPIAPEPMAPSTMGSSSKVDTSIMENPPIPGISSTSIEQKGGELSKPRINPDNLKHLYRNQRLLINVCEIIGYVYAACSTFGESQMKLDIEELINYLIDKMEMGENKHFEFLKQLSNDNNFKMAIKNNEELSGKIESMYILNSKAELNESTIGDKKLTLVGEQKCSDANKKINSLIENGGSFTSKDALLLAFCDNAMQAIIRKPE
jgi:hypothetical protein